MSLTSPACLGLVVCFWRFTLFEGSRGGQDSHFQREQERKFRRYINVREGMSQVVWPSSERGKSRSPTLGKKEKAILHAGHQMVELTRDRVVAVLKAQWVRRPCSPPEVLDLLKPHIHSFSPFCALTICKEICNWPAINRVKDLVNYGPCLGGLVRKLDNYYLTCSDINSPVFPSWCCFH